MFIYVMEIICICCRRVMLHCRGKCKRKPNRKTSRDIEAQTSFYNKQLVRIQEFADNEKVNIISYVQNDTHMQMGNSFTKTNYYLHFVYVRYLDYLMSFP